MRSRLATRRLALVAGVVTVLAAGASQAAAFHDVDRAGGLAGRTPSERQLLAGLEAPTVQRANAARGCLGRQATIVGTPGPDRLRGTAQADVIAGLGGNDRIASLEGDDLVCAGAGADTVLGGPGDDWLDAGSGRDTLDGGPGADTCELGETRRRCEGEGAVFADCELDNGGISGLNEGLTDPRLALPAQGTVRAVMLFVDFEDAPASETVQELYDLLVPAAARWLAEVSYGRLALDVTAVDGWYRMPRASPTYGFGDGLSFQEHRAYIAEAVAAADSGVDFSPFDVVYVVSSRGAAIPLSPAFLAYPGSGVSADGNELRLGATFGADIRLPADYGANVLVHETGHLLGLPDLYEYGVSDLFAALRHAGAWDTMSWVAPGGHFLGWHKRKLGWLDSGQVVCVEAAESVEATLAPLEIPGGTKLLVVRTGPSQAYVVEVREALGEDSWLCDQGVVVYRVDAAVPNGDLPIRVAPAQQGANPALRARCGPIYAAPHDLGAGETSGFLDPVTGVRVQVMAAVDDGYRVRVTRSARRPAALPEPAGATGRGS